MTWTPPAIVGSSFLDIESTDHKYLGKGAVARAAYDLHKGISFVRRVVGVEALSLTQGTRTYDTSYTQHAHPTVPADSTTRLRYKVDSGSVTIGWRLKGHAHVRRATLEIYRPNVLLPVWTHDLQWDDGAPSANGSHALDLTTLVPFDFGDDRAVYKLRLRVLPGEYRREVMSRWVYFVIEPPTWVSVLVRERPAPGTPVEGVAIKLVPPGLAERVVSTDAQGAYKSRFPDGDGPFKVTELAYDEEVDEGAEEPMFWVDALESAG